jgi:hypothetical protein
MLFDAIDRATRIASEVGGVGLSLMRSQLQSSSIKRMVLNRWRTTPKSFLPL